jgi:hypothetical protein
MMMLLDILHPAGLSMLLFIVLECEQKVAWLMTCGIRNLGTTHNISIDLHAI